VSCDCLKTVVAFSVVVIRVPAERGNFVLFLVKKIILGQYCGFFHVP
jgi:hypothetical protein